MELLQQLIKSFWFILILTVGIGQELTTGCMDNGYQQWSPNPGSPACNYNQLAIIEGDCLYNDCLGVCPEILDNNGWISNLDFTDTQYDECGECGGDGSTCSDCNEVPNGTAYINPLCIDNINVKGCVGGDTGIPDCIIIDLFFEGLLISDSTETIKVFVTNLDKLRSLDIEFQYDTKLVNITKFSLEGTDLFNIGYVVKDTTFIRSDDLSQVNFTLYFEPHTADLELFSLSEQKHVFNIVLGAPYEIQADTTTHIIINKLLVNEILMDDSNWVGGEISVMMHSGCTDDGFQDWSPNPGTPACNYDIYAGNDDGGCKYDDACGDCPVKLYDWCNDYYCGEGECDEGGCKSDDYCWWNEQPGQSASCVEDAINYIWVPNDKFTNTQIAHNCNCTDADEYDCYGYCILDDCLDELSFFNPGCAFIETNCNVCVGGATERYPCEQDCEAILLSTGEWGGFSYEDNCGVCISNTVETVIPGELDSLDCFNSGFKIYNSNGIEEDEFIINENWDIFYVALHMQNLPDLLEGVIIDINFEESNLSFMNSKLNPSEFDTGLSMPGLLDSSYKLIETSNNGVFLADIYFENTNVPSQENEGNILFLQFSNLGINGESTVINYNKILINEHAMKEENYTSQIIYFGDCKGEWGGDAVLDECNVCDGDGSSCAVYVESTITTMVDETDLENMETFEDNFESLLETSMGLPSGTVRVISVVILPSRSIEIEVDFSITLTDEEFAGTDFVTIENFEDFLVDVEDKIEDGGIAFTYGCSDEDACNYNIDVTIDDGSCTDIVEGACDCAGNTPEDLYVECVDDIACDCDGDLSINGSLIPQNYTLSPNYPNPFNPITYIHYSVPNYDFINIDIINISGQIIKTIVQSSHQPGNYEIIWDGTNHYEISVPSGIYFYKMDADEFVSVKKLVLLK